MPGAVYRKKPDETRHPAQGAEKNPKQAGAVSKNAAPASEPIPAPTGYAGGAKLTGHTGYAGQTGQASGAGANSHAIGGNSRSAGEAILGAGGVAGASAVAGSHSAGTVSGNGVGLSLEHAQQATTRKTSFASSGRPSGAVTSGAAPIRGWHIMLSPSLVLMLSILLLITLTLFFVFGLVVGRGSIPAPSPVPLERYMPEGLGAAEGEGQPERILPEEDLRFMANLKEPGTTSALPLAPGQTAGQTHAQAGGKPSQPGQAGQTAPTGQTGQTVPAGQQVTPKPAANPDQLYDFVLRVAAFKSSDQADALREKLEGAGLRTKMVTEKADKGTWYFVQVLARGNEARLQEIRDILPKYGVKDSILSSKTPVKN